MKTTKTAILSIIALATTLAFTSCKTTGDIGADTQSFWNSDAVQTQLQLIQNEAFAFLNNYLAGMMGSAGPKSKAMAASPNSEAQKATVAHLKAKFPGVPETVLVGAAARAAK